jgi:hypothetical protein
MLLFTFSTAYDYMYKKRFESPYLSAVETLVRHRADTVEQACRTRCVTKDRLKKSDSSEGYHMGGENHNRLLLLILGFSLRYIFRFSIFPTSAYKCEFH